MRKINHHRGVGFAAPARLRVSLVGLLLVTGALPLFHGRARAHMGSTKYVSTEAREDGARVIVDVDAIDVAFELGVDAWSPSLLTEKGEQIRTWVRDGIRLSASGQACDVAVSRPSGVDRDGLAYVSMTLDFTCARGGPFLLRDDTVFDDDARHEAILRIGSGANAGAHVLRASSREVDIGAPPTMAHVIVEFVWEGALHLFTGYDHILFLLSLLLVAGEVAAREGFKQAVRNVALVVTGFTVGHSVTLIAAALDVVALPSQLVESAIALSIVIVAVWNLYKPEARTGLAWVAAVFGLIHGFGFSSVLRELVLPSDARVVALLSFNVGIELAQLLIAAAVLGPLAWAAKKKWYRSAIVQGGSTAIALVAAYWFVTRAFGIA